jgi:hypothetical protein
MTRRGTIVEPKARHRYGEAPKKWRFSDDEPETTTMAAAGDSVIPACPACGRPTAREVLDVRRCQAGHRSRLVLRPVRGHGTKWESIAC